MRVCTQLKGYKEKEKKKIPGTKGKYKEVYFSLNFNRLKLFFLYAGPALNIVWFGKEITMKIALVTIIVLRVME